MTPYDMRLTNRARVWALLCHTSRSGGAALPDRLFEREPADGAALLERLATAGLVATADGTDGGPSGYVLTDRGHAAARRTLDEGVPPALVMHDPAEWRQRAWMAIRILRRFEVADVARVADAPGYDSVRRYVVALVAAAVLVEDGFVSRGAARTRRYRLVVDGGPMDPLADAAERRRETDPARPWRKRAWSAMVRLGRAGAGFSRLDLVVAAGISYADALVVLGEMVEAGAVVRAERKRRPGDLQWQWLYSLTGQDAAGREAVRPDRGRQGWRAVAYRALRASRLTAEAVAERACVQRATAYRLCEALVRAGLATAEPVEQAGTRGPSPAGYQLVPDAPLDCPDRIVLKWPAGAAGAEETATAEAHDG